MNKAALTIPLLLLLVQPVFGQGPLQRGKTKTVKPGSESKLERRKIVKEEDTEPLPDTLDLLLTDEFLDTVTIRKASEINDYTMIGANYGVTFSNTQFNPSKHNRIWVYTPNYASVMYTRYGKMFDYISNFGLQIGFAYGHEGYGFEADPETGRIAHCDTATWCSMSVVEVPMLAQIHMDRDPVKFMANVGIYGGYRRTISRTGNINSSYQLSEFAQHSFREYENRVDYGLQGGVGVAYMLDPVELHFNVGLRWSWASLYEPDYASQYYYRYAYPIDIMATIGVHFQVTKRKGKTTHQLKKEAKEIVYGKTEDTESQDRENPDDRR